MVKDYSKGKIYRLVCNTTGNQYIGSTVQSLSQRLGSHKSSFKRFSEGKITKKSTSFSIQSENNFKMILIEDYPCKNIYELEQRERHFIETMECVNKNKPARTEEEYIELRKQYNKDHQKEKQAYNRLYHNENKERINEQQKHYALENKEKISKYQQQYRKDHKEELSALTICECGGQYKYKYRAIHFKSIKHTSYLTNE